MRTKQNALYAREKSVKNYTINKNLLNVVASSKRMRMGTRRIVLQKDVIRYAVATVTNAVCATTLCVKVARSHLRVEHRTRKENHSHFAVPAVLLSPTTTITGTSPATCISYNHSTSYSYYSFYCCTTATYTTYLYAYCYYQE